MFIKKNGLFSFLESYGYQLSCDVCNNLIAESEVMSVKNGFSVTSTANSKMVCISCFDKDITKYRIKEFHNYHSNESCCICAANFNSLTKDEAQKKIRHICQKCVKHKTHPDNEHSFGPSFGSEYWSSCYDCGCLRIKNKIAYSYWVIGNAYEQSSISACVQNKNNKRTCSHSYIVVADYRKSNSEISNREVLKLESDLRKKLPILQHDPTPILTIESVKISKNGYLLKWCQICGNIERTSQ